jgi:hypothetical protein
MEIITPAQVPVDFIQGIVAAVVATDVCPVDVVGEPFLTSSLFTGATRQADRLDFCLPVSGNADYAVESAADDPAKEGEGED